LKIHTYFPISGSFSLKGVIDPAVGVVQKNGEVDRLSEIGDIPKGKLYQ
jgi:hypothetical protein